MQPKKLENGLLAGKPSRPMTDALRGYDYIMKDGLLPALVEGRRQRYGFVSMVDAMPRLYPVGATADQVIVDAARVSYQGVRHGDTNGTERLLRYLLRHRHCYHPSMQVLTLEGWKRWDECDAEETFLVPNPDSRTYTAEKLPVEVFDADEEMVTFENNRMSFSVTGDHRMWFKTKHHDDFRIYRAAEMPRWGNFDSLTGYCYDDASGRGYDKPAALAGFILGDGCWSGNNVTFHLKKQRKLDFLFGLLNDMEIKHTVSPSGSHDDAFVIYVPGTVLPQRTRDLAPVGQKSRDKAPGYLPIDIDQSWGLWEGLRNSDGHTNSSRGGRVEFASSSFALARAFETLSQRLGMDAHKVTADPRLHAVTAYPHGGRTTLQSRGHFYGTEHHKGKVYCATTSTGLLAVRGGPDKFGFVCGNTSPFEQVSFRFHVRAPIFVARQWLRHRTAKPNEISARYAEIPSAFFLPEASDVRFQPPGKGQTSVNDEDRESIGGGFSLELEAELKRADALYRKALAEGIAREQARSIQPVGMFTEFVWKIDLHNLLHFISLRANMAKAQPEIAVYAQAILDLIRPIVPMTVSAFEDYHPARDGMLLTALDIAVIRAMLLGGDDDSASSIITNKRERQECVDKLRRLGIMDTPRDQLPCGIRSAQ